MGTRNTNTRCVESMMRTRRRRSAMSALLVIVGSVFAPGMVVIDHPGADVIPPRVHQRNPPGAPSTSPWRLYITTAGVPPGWQFTLPSDPVAGREVFVAMKCYTCHTIAGEEFPLVKPAECAGTRS